MCVQRNIQARICDHGCSGEAISTTYYGCLFVASGIKQGMRMCHIVICELSGYTIFVNIIS